MKTDSYAGPLRRRDDQTTQAGDGYEKASAEGGGDVSTTGRPSDERLLQEIYDLLIHHPDVEDTPIEVLVESGEVTLHGSVAEPDARWLIEELVASVAGVSLVHNRVRVAPR